MLLWTKTASGAPKRELDEGAVCVEVVFCIREAAEGGRCVRRRASVHTECGFSRQMGAKRLGFAHERAASDEAKSGTATDSRRA